MVAGRSEKPVPAFSGYALESKKGPNGPSRFIQIVKAWLPLNRVSSWLPRLLISDQSDREIDQDEAAEAYQRAEDETEANDQRVNPEVIANARAYAHQLAIVLVEVEASVAGRATGGVMIDLAHATPPVNGVA